MMVWHDAGGTVTVPARMDQAVTHPAGPTCHPSIRLHGPLFFHCFSIDKAARIR
jgi:hypothetical protein